MIIAMSNTYFEKFVHFLIRCSPKVSYLAIYTYVLVANVTGFGKKWLLHTVDVDNFGQTIGGMTGHWYDTGPYNQSFPTNFRCVIFYTYQV